MTQEEIDAVEGEYWYCWEEADYMENKLFYEYDGSTMLRSLEELPTKGKHGTITKEDR